MVSLGHNELKPKYNKVHIVCLILGMYCRNKELYIQFDLEMNADTAVLKVQIFHAGSAFVKAWKNALNF